MARKGVALLPKLLSPLPTITPNRAADNAWARSCGSCRSFSTSMKRSNPSKTKATKGKASKVKEESKQQMRATSGYREFQSSAAGKSVLAKHPEATTIGEKAKLLAAAWKLLSEAKRKPYAEDAAASKVRLPPRSAYNLFKREAGKQILAKHPHAKFPEFGTILAAEWSKVPDAEKQEWAAKLDKISPRPPKKASKASGYATWVKDNYSRVANGGSSVKAKDVLRELGSVWRTLDAGEKQKYLKH